jgi:hypothetical protein
VQIALRDTVRKLLARSNQPRSVLTVPFLQYPLEAQRHRSHCVRLLKISQRLVAQRLPDRATGAL